MLLWRWSNDNVIHGSQRQYFFHKTKVVRLETRVLCSCWSLVSTIRGTKIKVKTPATTLTKIAFPQINCNVKETQWRLQQKNVRYSRKATFHYCKKFSCTNADLNEIKCDNIDSKQHFYLQYLVAATDVKALRKKQMTLQAVAYLGFPAPGNKLS